jgi:predicted amidohydrolase
MPSTRLSPERRAEVEALGQAIREAVAAEIEELAETLLSTDDRHVFGQTELRRVVIVGFNELRGHDLYNTALVAHKGHLLGTYSKCFAYMPFHEQGRTFPVFEHKGVKFGVVFCADGGYVEPARILALKGARVTAPALHRPPIFLAAG